MRLLAWAKATRLPLTPAVQVFDACTVQYAELYTNLPLATPLIDADMANTRTRYLLVSNALGYPPAAVLILVILFGMSLANLVGEVHLWLCERGGYTCTLASCAPRGTALFSFVVLGLYVSRLRARSVADVSL